MPEPIFKEKYNSFSRALLHAQCDLDLGVLIVDPGSFRIVFANQALEKIAGYRSAELSQLPSFLSLILPQEQEQVLGRLEKRFKELFVPGHYDATVLHKDGSQIRVEVADKTVMTEEGKKLVALIHNVSDARTQSQLIGRVIERMELQAQRVDFGRFP